MGMFETIEQTIKTCYSEVGLRIEVNITATRECRYPPLKLAALLQNIEDSIFLDLKAEKK